MHTEDRDEARPVSRAFIETYAHTSTKLATTSSCRAPSASEQLQAARRVPCEASRWKLVYPPARARDAMPRSTVGAALSKQIAASGGWACAACDAVLPAAYEIDHIIPIADGGHDDRSNMQALCPNCHAAKTQTERIRRTAAAASRRRRGMYADRNDTFSNGIATCTLCLRRRRDGTPHPVCWTIEARCGRPPRIAPLDHYRRTSSRYAFPRKGGRNRSHAMTGRMTSVAKRGLGSISTARAPHHRLVAPAPSPVASPSPSGPRT